MLPMEVSKFWKIVEFPKTSIKVKNCKTFYQAWTVSRIKKIIASPPNQKKAYYASRTKTFL